MAQRLSNLFGQHKRRLEMIARVIAVDPNPPKGADTDLLVYQIAGKRHLELLLEVFEKAEIEAVVVETPPRVKKS